MAVLVAALRIAVAAVLLVAAALKARDRHRAVESTAALGVPRGLAGPLTGAVVAAELALAVLLVPATTARAAAIAAAALLAVFSIGLALNLLRGNAPSCSCFGGASDEPISWRSLVRNGVLIALAGAAAALSPQPSIPGWVASLSASGLAALAAILALSLLTLGLLEGLRVLGGAPREEGLSGSLARGEHVFGVPERTPVAPFELPDLAGTLHKRTDLALKTPVLLAFVHPDCNACRESIAGLERFADTVGSFLGVAVVASGSAGDVEREFGRTSLRVLLDAADELGPTLELAGTPSAVLVNPNGTTGSPVATGAGQLSQLLRTLAQSAGEEGDDDFASGLERGQPTPVDEIETHDGQLVSLVEPGVRTAVVFLRRDCAHCHVVLDYLWVWERLPEEQREGLRVLLVGTDIDSQPYLEHGIGLPLAMDPERRGAKQFHVKHIPSAVVIGGDGMIEVPLVRGARRVVAALGVELERDRIEWRAASRAG